MNAITRRTAALLVGLVEGFIPIAASLATGIYLFDRTAPLLDMPLVDNATDIKAVAILGALLALAAVSSFTDGPLETLRYKLLGRPYGPCPHCGESVLDPHLTAEQFGAGTAETTK